ncbi:hypothetical protein [Acaryochloris sp. 'Moss Beach']|uniref:hypothetical protein n=1 Tax=Acaryochloris sp. 'Moss Beach' TaxID=2740837 RepID=UPI001F38F461|nr:hypothetical protein [Acaryochloris sp. 'Moss Beach']
MSRPGSTRTRWTPQSFESYPISYRFSVTDGIGIQGMLKTLFWRLLEGGGFD